MKTTFLTRTLIIILITVTLSAVFTALVFNYTGTRVFANQKAEEISPRAKYIAEMTADYLRGYIGVQSYKRAIGGEEYRIWDASLYIYNAAGQLFVYPDNTDNTANLKALESYISRVLAGEVIASPLSSGDIGVIVGEPVVVGDSVVIGAVFLIKSLNEVRTALGGLTIALIISMIAVMASMMIPAYLTSKRMMNPLKQMNEVAIAMAEGNFSVRAKETGSYELMNLAKSFNRLSDELSRTIGYLTHERNRLFAVINGLGEGIIAADSQNNITLYNPAAVRLLGGGAESPIRDLPAFLPILEAISSDFKDLKPRFGEIKMRNRILSFTVTPLFDSNHRASKETVTLIRDVTESVRLEQTRREYVANVSHELRTPVSSIRSLADALNDGLIRDEGDRARYYGYILRESIRLSHLIDDLLELSRLQSGAVAIDKQRMDAIEMLYDVADRYASIAGEKNMAIHLNLPEDVQNIAEAYSNPDRAEQVLIILLDNAIKHADTGDIDVTLTDAGNKLTISVENDGNISEDDISHIFERFYKVDKSHSGKGTGLGLSIASEIMALLKERIWVECEEGRIKFAFELSKYEA